MEPEVKVEKNGSSIKGDSVFYSGDTIDVSVDKNGSWGASTIEILDPMSNRRFLSRRLGQHRISTIIPDTRSYGTWSCRIEVKDGDGNITTVIRSLEVAEPELFTSIRYETMDSGSREERDEITDDVSNEISSEGQISREFSVDITEGISGNEQSMPDDNNVPSSEVSEVSSVDSELVANPADPSLSSKLGIAERDTGMDTPEKNAEKHQEDDEETISSTLEQVDIEELEKIIPSQIEMTDLPYEEQKLNLSMIETQDELGRIVPIKLSGDDRNDLEIPIAELDDIDREFQQLLKDADILYIYHLLEGRPLEIWEITGAEVSQVRAWLEHCYLILSNKDHGLRKEYRKIRTEYAEFQRQLEKLMESKRAQDPLNVLVGVNSRSIRQLTSQGITTVGELLQFPIIDLINLGVDPEKPLLPKLWIANAKSYVGIK